jgi:hypothetical protein
MSENLQGSSSLSRIVEDITHLKQRLESFERHVHNTKEEVISSFSQDLDAEKALCHFALVFNDRTA